MYLFIVFASIAAIAVNLNSFRKHASAGQERAGCSFPGGIHHHHHGLFHHGLQPMARISQAILICLMFVGACAGSTGGGIKVSRILILFKSARRNLHNVFHPEEIRTVRIDGERVSEKTIQHVQAYLALYVFIVIISFLLVSLGPKGSSP